MKDTRLFKDSKWAALPYLNAVLTHASIKLLDSRLTRLIFLLFCISCEDTSNVVKPPMGLEWPSSLSAAVPPP